MKKNIFKIIAGTTLIALSGLSNADREFADIYTECGLGAMIAPNNEAVAAVTNVTWDLGTTAISSDASSEENCKGGKTEAAAFIYDSFENIEIDTAKGYGDYASTLANMYGCNGQQADALIDIMRSELKGIVSGQDYDSQTKYQRSEKFYNSLTPQAQALGCSA